MPRRKLRTRFLRRIKKKLPGGAFVMHYTKRKPAKAKCAKCKKPLRGVPRASSIKMKRIAKTKKKPERAYGGYLCASCLKEELKAKLME